MDKDGLIQEIVEKLEDGEDVLIPTVKQYHKDILMRYAGMKDLLPRSNGTPKHARTLVLLWKYINNIIEWYLFYFSFLLVVKGRL